VGCSLISHRPSRTIRKANFEYGTRNIELQSSEISAFEILCSILDIVFLLNFMIRLEELHTLCI
jgi:hypothetical protein